MLVRLAWGGLLLVSELESLAHLNSADSCFFAELRILEFSNVIHRVIHI